MTVRMAQFVHASNDVLDEGFMRDVPEVGEEQGTQPYS